MGAPAVVIVTVAILLWRNLRPAKEASCDEEWIAEERVISIFQDWCFQNTH